MVVFIFILWMNGKRFERNSVPYHLQIKTLEPFRASLLQVQQHVNWTSRGEFSYHRRYVSSLVWRKMLFWLET